jgi:hypothetical protein
MILVCSIFSDFRVSFFVFLLTTSAQKELLFEFIFELIDAIIEFLIVSIVFVKFELDFFELIAFDVLIRFD